MIPPPPTSTLFPHPPLFLSSRREIHKTRVHQKPSTRRHVHRHPHYRLRSATRIGWISKYFPQPEVRSEEHTSELQSLTNLLCRLLLEKNQRALQYHPRILVQ